MQYFYYSVKLHREDMIAISNPRILLHTTCYPVRNTYSVNVHEYSCNDCYSSKQFITKPYDTFNHLTDPRGCLELTSTYGVFLSFLLLQEIFCKIFSSILFFLNYVVHGKNVRLSAQFQLISPETFSAINEFIWVQTNDKISMVDLVLYQC